MRHHGLATGGLAIALSVLCGTALIAQQGLPRGPETLMHPQYDRRQPVSPIFEGWSQNRDGTYTLSFGFFNRNAEEDIEIPLGPDNFIEPAEFDGQQPTSFPAGLDQGRGWSVFAVVVSEDFTPSDRVVWSLTSKGRTYTVPGKIGIEAYRLYRVDQPVGNGSMPPRVRFDQRGPEGLGHSGISSDTRLTTTVGDPLRVGVWAADNFQEGRRDAVPVELTWFKHQGPPEGSVVFSNGEENLEVPGEGGEATTTATFSAPGEYVLRVEAGNFSVRDSGHANHCCWTNGYVTVTVMP